MDSMNLLPTALSATTPTILAIILYRLVAVEKRLENISKRLLLHILTGKDAK